MIAIVGIVVLSDLVDIVVIDALVDIVDIVDMADSLDMVDSVGIVDSAGSTYAKSQGNSGKYYATSMSNPDAQNWSQITGHQHTYGGATFKCNVGSQTSYTFYDINSSGVNIVNTAGENAGAININTETPSLTMVYIIKAY